MEEWKEIKGFEGLYQISNYGNVKSLANGKSRKEKLLKPSDNGKGYLKVNLWKDGKMKNKQVHQLVAEAFIPNPSNLPFINHKDENPSNNVYTNLEWCTAAYNNNYGTHNQRMTESLKNSQKAKEQRSKLFKKLSKHVYQYTLEGTLVKIWSSSRECGRNGFNQGHIAACCRGEKKQHKGYIWKYKKL